MRKEFNPFNLKPEASSKEHKIKFERFESRIKTKPLWWFIAALAFVVLIYLYLKFTFS